jgi:hypothetical protein
VGSTKKTEIKYEDLRRRHIFCITKNDIIMDVIDGRVPRYHEQPDRYAPVCDNPDDIICAAPSTRDEDIWNAIKDYQQQISGN